MLALVLAGCTGAPSDGQAPSVVIAPGTRAIRGVVVDDTVRPVADATDWTCDPFCIGNELNITTGGTPLYLTDTITNGTTVANTGEGAVTDQTRFSTFVWPDWGHGDPTNADVAYDQKFRVFATAFHHLPGPDGWSFLDGEPAPF